MTSFGLGQPGNGPVQNQDEEQEEEQEQEQEDQQQDGPQNPPEEKVAWGLWPEPQQDQEVNLGPNLNIVPQVEDEMEIDLNQPEMEN